MTPWWTGYEGNLFGAIGGSLIGVVGGTLGALAGVLAPRGKGRGFILGSFAALILLGVVLLAVGLFAVVAGQPYYVWYPLVLCGGILTLVLSCTLPGIRARYRQAEARRMDAEALRRS